MKTNFHFQKCLLLLKKMNSVFFTNSKLDETSLEMNERLFISIDTIQLFQSDEQNIILNQCSLHETFNFSSKKYLIFHYICFSSIHISNGKSAFLLESLKCMPFERHMLVKLMFLGNVCTVIARKMCRNAVAKIRTFPVELIIQFLY